MFVARVGLCIIGAFFVASCGNQAAVKTHPVAELRKPAVPVARLSKIGADYRPAVMVAARRERSMIDVEKPIEAGLLPSASQSTLVREKAKPQDEEAVQASITSVSRSTQDPLSQRIVQDAKFLEGLAKDDTENQLLQRKTIICRGC